jgi:hypothetical protein
MKSAVLVCALCLSFSSIFAQQVASLNHEPSLPLSLFTSTPLSAPQPQVKRLPGYRQRNVGRVMTLGGLALVTGGLILMNSGAPRSTHPNVTGQEPDPREPLGFMMAYSGVGLTIPGIILWKKGSKKYKRSLEREGLAIQTGTTGLSIAYSF